MKLKTKILILIFASSTSLYANDTAIISASQRKKCDVSPILTPKMSIASWVYVPVLNFSIQSGSSSIPLSFMSKFAFGGSISSSEMSDYEKKLDMDNRMGYYQNYSISLHPAMFGTEISKEVNFQIEVESMLGLKFKRDAFRLFMQGNTPYLGQELNAGNLVFEQWRNRIYRLNTKSITWNGWTINPSIQISQNLSFSSIETNNLKFYSSPNGDSLSLNGAGFYANNNYSFWGNGFGVQAGFLTQKSINSPSSNYIKIVGFGLKNFGIYSLSEVNIQSRNAVWDASGNGMTPVSYNESKPINLTAVNIPANDLQVSNWLTRQKDSVNAKLNISEMKRSGYVLSPFQANAYIYFQKRTVGNAIMHRLQLNYIYLTGYVPSLIYSIIKPVRLNLNYSGKSSSKLINFSLYAGVSVGGFDNFDINGGFQFPMKSIKGFNKPSLLNLQFYGIESFFVPSIFHGAGGSIRWLIAI